MTSEFAKNPSLDIEDLIDATCFALDINGDIDDEMFDDMVITARELGANS